MIGTHHKWNRSIPLLVLGLLGSVLLTYLAYWIAKDHIASGPALLGAVMGLTTLQALVQCVCFLHIGGESKPHWSLISLIFTIIVLIIIVGGSLWIMYNLNYNMMPGM